MENRKTENKGKRYKKNLKKKFIAGGVRESKQTRPQLNGRGKKSRPLGKWQNSIKEKQNRGRGGNI